MSQTPVKPLEWVASSKKDLLSMPTNVVDTFGYALHLAQNGGKHAQAKPLKGFGSAGVFEVVEETMTAIPTGRCIPYDSAMRSMCCIASRKNRTKASQHPSKTWT